MKYILKKVVIFIIQCEAILVLKKYKPNIVAVTGSVGKTSTKDAVYTVLSGSFFVRKSEKSFNSEIGVPLTILGVPNGWSSIPLWLKNITEGFLLIIFRNHYPTWLVLEVGADRPGDIKKISRWLKPDIVVMTSLPSVPVHVEFFKSAEHVAREKEHLIRALKYDGVLVLNGDDERVRSHALSSGQSVFMYGFDKRTDFQAQNSEIEYMDGKPSGMTFRVSYCGSSTPISVQGTIGNHQIYPILAACAVGASQGLNMVKIAEVLNREYTPPPGRMRLIEGKNGSTLIDDTYNSSPAAVGRALETLERVTVKGKKIAVLGDMLELGSHTADAHLEAGKKAAEFADILITVGIRARDIAEGARKEKMKKGQITITQDAREAGMELTKILKSGDLALVKGSQGVRMERIVEEVMAHPDKARTLLPRQEKEWLRRV